MSKKFYIIIAVVLVLFLLALGAYYFLLQSNNTAHTGGVAQTFKNFFPFGGSTPTNSTTGTTGNTNGNQNSTGQTQQDFTQKLRHIWAQPVAGFTLFTIPAGITIRHMDTATGHVYDTELFSPNQTRISNTTMPTAYTATWGTDQNTFIAQFLKDDNRTIDTYSLSLKTSSTTPSTSEDAYELSGALLPAHTSWVSVSNSNLFYLVENTNSSTGFVSTFDGSKKKQVWSSPIREVLPQFVNDSTVALTTSPYQNISGYLYFVNTGTAAVKKILGDIPGLSTLVSPDAKQVAYLASGGGVITFADYTVSSQSSQPLSPATFPEKCVWSKKDAIVLYCAVPRELLNDTSLTSWYMGTTQYTDDIWKYDLKANTSKIIESLVNDTNSAIDVEKPTLSANDQFLVFQNKRDGSLWSLDLTK